MITEPDGISETYLLEVQSSCMKLIGSQERQRGEKMHQIYSCNDENLEVFTVISSKYKARSERSHSKSRPETPLAGTSYKGDFSCNPIRRKTKGTQCILSKKVVAVSSYQPQGADELLSHQGDLIQVFCKNKDGRDFSHLKNRQKGFFPNPVKCPETHTEVSKQSFSCGNNQSNVKSLQPQASPGSHHNANWIATTEPAIRDGAAERHAVLSWKSTEDDAALNHGTEASLPLTGSTLQGTPSLLRKIWMKHKKKAEYLGATNGAFEAD